MSGVQTASATLKAALSHVTGPFRNWSTSTSRYPLGYMPTLDGIRGYMALVVLAAHTRLDIVSGAALYMDVFFVMSGYLITSLLIGDYLKNGRLNLKKFYYRRFTRLYPALGAMLICLLILSLLFSRDLPARATEVVVSTFYSMNYYGIYIGTFGGFWYTLHLWSLTIEEQFYMLWPLLFAVLLRCFGLSRRTMWVTLGIAAVVAAGRIYLNYEDYSVLNLHVAFHTRADSLLIGCALAIALRFVDIGRYPRLSPVLSAAPLLLFALSLFGVLTLNHLARSYFYVWSLVSACGTALAIAVIAQSPVTVGRRLFEHPVLIFFGRICYGLYVWHWPVFRFLLYDGVVPGPYWLRAVAAWILAFGLGTASYLLLERRFMSVREATGGAKSDGKTRRGDANSMGSAVAGAAVAKSA